MEYDSDIDLKQPKHVSNSIAKPLEDSSSSDTIQNQYILYPYRWIICLFFSTQQIGLGIAMIGFSPIISLLSDVYGVNSNVATMLVLWYQVFIPLNFAANKLIDSKGIALPIRIAWVLFIVGAWIRVLIKVNFYFVLIGQWINAFGMPFVQAIGATIAGAWFGDKERALVTTITSLASVFGIIIGFALPVLFVNDDDKANPDQAKIKVWNFILVQSIIITVLSAPVFLFIKNNPKTPPSRSAEKKFIREVNNEKTDNNENKSAQRKEFWKDMKDLLWSVNFWLLNFVFALIYAVYNTLGASVGVITQEFGYTSTDNSIFGVIFIVSGIAGSFVHAVLLDKYCKYKLHLVLVTFISLFATGALTLVINLQNIFLTSIGLFFFGIGLVPIIGVGNSFWAEIIYPIGEATGCGFMLVSGSILSIPYALITNYTVQNWSKWWSMILFGSGWLLSVFISLFIKEELKKTVNFRPSPLFQKRSICSNTLSNPIIEEKQSY